MPLWDCIKCGCKCIADSLEACPVCKEVINVGAHKFHRERSTGHDQEKAPEVVVPEEVQEVVEDLKKVVDEPAKDEKQAGK